MQVLDNLIGILAHDLADYYDGVCAVTSPTTDDFSESVKTAVEQSLKRFIPHVDFRSLNETYYLVCPEDITLMKKDCISFVK